MDTLPDLTSVKNAHLLPEIERKDIKDMSKRFINLTGQKFNKLTAISLVGIRKKQSIWLYQCDCGTYTLATAGAVSTGHTITCGCSLKETAAGKRTETLSGEIGKTYGKLTITSFTESIDYRTAVNARCVCGNEKAYVLRDIQSGNTKSCGCSKISARVEKCREDAKTLIGSVFGKLTILSVVDKTEGKTEVFCRCSCGTEGQFKLNTLKTGNTTSCGCAKTEMLNNQAHINVDASIGKLYGRLEILSFDSAKTGKSWVNCKCKCGQEKSIPLGDIKLGKIQSCGCLRPKYANESIRQLAGNLTRLVSGSFQRNLIKKSANTVEIMGISRLNFIEHLKSQFEPWMNEENHGHSTETAQRTWSIDHIIPSSYAQSLEDLLYINHYTNLRPLCSIENVKKSGYLPDDFAEDAFIEFKKKVDSDRETKGFCSIQELLYKIEKTSVVDEETGDIVLDIEEDESTD